MMGMGEHFLPGELETTTTIWELGTLYAKESGVKTNKQTNCYNIGGRN